jgi:hypothetical protein
VKDAYGNVLGLTYPPYGSAAAARAAADRAATAVGRTLNRMKNEYEKPVKGTYDSATKKHAEEEDKYLDEAFDQELQKAFEDYLRMSRTRMKIEELQKNAVLESDVPRPIVTVGLLGDEPYIGLITPKGDTMWMKLDTVLKFNNNR